MKRCQRLNVKSFSDLIGCHAIGQIESSRHYREKLEEIPNLSIAFLICALHISAGCAHFLEEFGAPYSEVDRGFRCDVEQIVTLVHTWQILKFMEGLWLPSIEAEKN